MADISQIKVLDGTTYNIKDSTARTQSLPSGGTTGQALVKNSNSDYAVTWSTFSVPSAATTAPANLAASASVGVGTTFARADHVHKRPTASEIGAIATPATASASQFLMYNGSSWVAASLPLYNGEVS